MQHDDYRTMLADTPYKFCWLCGSDLQPAWWAGRWALERAHIVNKPRREDRRAVVILCSICHRVSHGERIRDAPEITREHLLWIKRELDGEFYDPVFLQENSVTQIGLPTKPETYMLVRESRQPFMHLLSKDGGIEWKQV